MAIVTPEHLGGFIPLDQRSITPSLWRYLLERFGPRTMLDVGCGEGWPVLWYLAHKVDAYGLDGDPGARAGAVIPPDRFVLYDFAKGAPAWRPDVDLILCVEFVEHVEEQFLPGVLEVFRNAKVVAMTFARPLQPGHHHVNCQPEEYWIEKLASIGFKLDEQATRETRALPEVQARDAYWGRTGLVFVRA